MSGACGADTWAGCCCGEICCGDMYGVGTEARGGAETAGPEFP